MRVVRHARREAASRLSAGRMPAVRFVGSPNHDSRPPHAVVDLLVIHHISLPPGRYGSDSIERLFTNQLDHRAHPFFASLRGLHVSAHFLVRRDGALVQFVDTQSRAWHAGASCFLDRERCNDFSIGVELEGDGSRRFAPAQYRSLRWLLGWLRERHPLRWLAGHSDIAPGRKIDPGPTFDWCRLLDSREARGLDRPFPLLPTWRARTGRA